MSSTDAAPATPPDASVDLQRLVGRELDGSAAPEIRALCDAVLARFPADAVAAVLFYGSCLRQSRVDGVADFYVLVDSYRGAYPRRGLAWLNAMLPPNVFYLEAPTGDVTLRCKFAVLSWADFERGVSPASIHPYVWSRFSQPAQLLYQRDAASRERAVRGVAQAIETLVQRLCVFLPARRGRQRFSLAALWQEAFRRTYRSELRTESEDTIRALYDSDPARYDEAGAAALQRLAVSGWVKELVAHESAYEIRIPATRRLLTRLRWQLAKPVSKLLAFFRLLKNAGTFGDWLPYALWKLERHTGVTVELTPRQRRRPLIFAWPVIFRLLARRDLR